MRHGKKTLSYRIVYSSLHQIGKKTRRKSLLVFEQAIRKATPNVQLKTSRIGGTTYQIPVEIGLGYGISIAIRWILSSSRSRRGRGGIGNRLLDEILDTVRGVGGAVRKREEVHRVAESNKAFTRYRFLM
jgi:small subunit ribosomal protein S7